LLDAISVKGETIVAFALMRRDGERKP
jgi:hypothetical protein